MSISSGEIKLFLVIFFLFPLVNCASKRAEEKALQQQVQAQAPREMHGEVAQKGFEEIIQSKNLSEEQKEKLLKLHSQMAADTFKIQDETSKLKAVLFETMVQKPFNEKKVNIIKKQLIALNDQKMKNMLSAIDQVKDIIGNEQPQDIQDFYRPFFWEQAHENMK